MDPRESLSLRSLRMALMIEDSDRKPMSSFGPASNDRLVQDLKEKVLIEAAQAGYEWAFLELVNRHSLHVFNRIFRVTKNREDAEDALQNSLIKAHLHLRQFDQRSRFSAWFTRIGINSALMILRKRRVYRETSMVISGDSSGDVTHLDFADQSLNPEQRCAEGERIMQLRKAVRRLPKGLRTILQIQLEGDRSMREIAELSGASVPAVKSRLSRARKALREVVS